jgi:ATP-dependent DNA helicase RecQ
MLGAGATFRPDQLEAITAVVDDRSRVLVVQRTGWGKSLVYFLATRLLRDAGLGPTLLISPLLSLMRDQLLMAERIGVRAATINSENAAEWEAVEEALAADVIDLLLVSPERLANAQFAERTLGLIRGAIGLFAVDEAHCISDWGHDFRPDYRRIGRLVTRLPRGVPLLATTATANDRVVADIESQLGPELITVRGPLARESLRLQTIALDDQAERLAWLAERLPGLPGSGIVYCLTIADCERVAGWLASRGLDVAAYYGGLDPESRSDLEERLRRNEVKALVATIALGMGFDKPDLGFVLHFQRPGSPVAYY